VIRGLRLLDEAFGDASGTLARRFNTVENPDFFTTVSFHCDVDANLNWTLPQEEAKGIAKQFYRDPTADPATRKLQPWIERRLRGTAEGKPLPGVKGLIEWFGDGGH